MFNLEKESVMIFCSVACIFRVFRCPRIFCCCTDFNKADVLLSVLLEKLSIHSNESRTPPPDLLLESGHGITSLPFSDACTGFWSGYAYSINCVCLCNQVHIGHSPTYLADMMTATADLPGRERLRSANSFRYETPKLKLKFGERAFSYARPKAWNSLPSNLQELMNTYTFNPLLHSVTNWQHVISAKIEK